MTTQEFIQQYREKDVRELALQGARFPQIDLPYALDQIAGWQTARKKIPSWTTIEGITFPPRLSMEQCSSEQTARYKEALAERLLKKQEGSHRLVDLTGGFGVDFSFLSPVFDEAVYVEQQEHLCKIVQENTKVLGLRHSCIIHDDSISYLHQMQHVDIIYLDPARRDAHGARTFALQDCTPNILEIKDELLQKARWIIVKLSPMLDWHRAVSELPSVREVHVVSVGNECKELLLVMEGKESEQEESPMTIYCVNDEQVFTCSMNQINEGMRIAERIEKEMYLYEPNASIMKVGCFGVCAEQFDVKAIARNSHLFVSDTLIPQFPGRIFRITAVTSMNKRELKEVLQGVKKANVAVRNFPLKADELRKKLKLSDGGDIYLFGTTTEQDKHLVLLTKL
ncbi:MAG: RsmD family RNA methyltransferase [Prevotella sp.]|nr:RsmD family RNA methyltransferase [Prevotella sp.]